MNPPPASTPPPLSPLALRLGDLTAAKEKTYFVYVVVVSVLVWLALVCTIIGGLYALLIAFFLWLGHGMLAAHLRAEAVRVSENQLPELYATYLDVCRQLNVRQPPGLYVLQAGGTLNAFATRHAGRDFVVIFSDVLEALGPASPEIKFILGHEIGHLKSGHPLKQALLAPGLFFPLIGPAYRRAWETSCDRYGAYAAQDANGALRAMLTLSGGKTQGRALNAEIFAQQYEQERGFFVSLHELTSPYPTLSRRVRDLRSVQDDTRPARAPRNPFAYFFALFIPGGNYGSSGPAGALVMVVFIGLLAAMAIPAFQKVRDSSIQKACYNNRRMLEAALDQYVIEHGRPPKTFADLVGPGSDKYIKTMPVCLMHGVYSAQKNGDHYEVSCSIHGHGAPALPGASPP
jgi:Zn-dependent protease with chaperone function